MGHAPGDGGANDECEEDARVQVQPLPRLCLFFCTVPSSPLPPSSPSRESDGKRQQFEKRAAFSNAASCGAAAVCKILPPSLLHSVTDY